MQLLVTGKGDADTREMRRRGNVGRAKWNEVVRDKDMEQRLGCATSLIITSNSPFDDFMDISDTTHPNQQLDSL